jgi:hypothetical protein
LIFLFFVTSLSLFFISFHYLSCLYIFTVVLDVSIHIYIYQNTEIGSVHYLCLEKAKGADLSGSGM